MSNQETITNEGRRQESVTLKEAAGEYINELVLNNTKMTTVAVYQRSLQLAVNFFGADRKLESITLPHVGKFFASAALRSTRIMDAPKRKRPSGKTGECFAR